MVHASALRCRTWSLLGLFLLLASCGKAPTGCDLCTTSVTVAGRVETAAGAPIPAAAVTVAVRAPGCVEAARSVFDGATGGAPGTLTTDADGRFSIHLRSSSAPATYCLEVRAAVPGGAAPVIVQRDVSFEADWPERSTARVQVTLRVPPG